MNRTANVSTAKATLYKSVRMTVVASLAKEVLVTGDFTHWSRAGIPMLRIGAGIWETNLRLPRGEYQYRFIVDGAWRDDPDARKKVRNPFGGYNGVLVVE